MQKVLSDHLSLCTLSNVNVQLGVADGILMPPRFSEVLEEHLKQKDN